MTHGTGTGGYWIAIISWSFITKYRLTCRDPDQLGLDGLDAIDSAIVKQVLTRLAGEHGGQLRAWKDRGMAR